MTLQFKYILFVLFLWQSITLADTVVLVDSVQAETPSDTLNRPSDSAKKEASQNTKQIATTTPKAKIYQFDLNEPIFPAAWRKVKKAIDEAEKNQVDYIVMRLNTYGGAVDMADSIRSRILRAKPTTVVLIDNNAASAGALISIACDSIFMVESATIGAATVVDAEGKQVPDKYQSYMRAKMRATAESQGRDPSIAEAMVDDRISIEGIIDSGKTLTFTTSEAVQHNYCDGIFKNTGAVIAHLNGDSNVLQYTKQPLEDLISFLLNPMVSSLLMLVMFMGIYAEIQTPGVGFPIFASIIAGILYFAPNYLEGLAQYWEIILFVTGLLFIAIEIFVTPGVGFLGLTGLLAVIAGLSLSLVRNDFFDFTLTGMDEMTAALVRVLLSIFGAVALGILLGGRLLKSKAFQNLVLDSSQEGYSIEDKTYNTLIGKMGVAKNDLAIAGRIEIEGELYEAITTGDFIGTGSKVVVKKSRGNYLVVRKVMEETGEEGF